jgi:hypothetical protein
LKTGVQLKNILKCRREGENNGFLGVSKIKTMDNLSDTAVIDCEMLLQPFALPAKRVLFADMWEAWKASGCLVDGGRKRA